MDDLSVLLKEAGSVEPSFDSSKVRAAVQRRRNRQRFTACAGASMFVVLFAIAGVAVRSDGGPDASEVSVAGPVPSSEANGSQEASTSQIVTNVVDAGDGPKMCFISSADRSACNGPGLVGFDWSQVPWSERTGSVTSARALLVGHWNPSNQTFALTSPPADGSLHEDRAPERRAVWNEGIQDPGPSCAPPVGGWQTVAGINERSKDAAAIWLNARPDVAAVWQSRVGEPAGFVLNVRVAEGGDATAVEEGVRESFAGNLCITVGGSSRESLRATMARLVGNGEDQNVAGASLLEIPGRIRLVVWFAHPDLQAQLDSEYGIGTVEVVELLQPAE